MYRIEINNQGEKRYVNLEGDIIDIAVQLVQELEVGETYKKAEFRSGTNETKEGYKIILVTSGEKTEYETLEEAQSEAAKLPADEGYQILSEDPLNNTADYINTPTAVIEERPSFKV